MKSVSVSIATLLALFALGTAQAQQETEIPDSVAQFWQRLAKAKTITYTMKRWGWELVSDARPGRTIFYVLNTYDVKAQRPDRLSIVTSAGLEREVTEEGAAHREFLNEPAAVYINNGKQSITYFPGLRIYAAGKGMEALHKDKNNTALTVGAYWIFYPKPLSGCRLVPESLADTSNTVIYILSNPKYPDHHQQIYFDRKTGNLLRTSDFDKTEKGDWQESRREEFLFWDFDARLPAETFSVRPPRAYVTQKEYYRVKNIPSPEAPAPPGK